MIVALDVHYTEAGARAAAVGFRAWSDAAAAFERVLHVAGAPAAYSPGKFYLRELPYLLAVLETLDRAPGVLIVDGYVTLGARPGLGAHLFQALAGRAAVVGVAKNEFAGAPAARVLRGTSKKPLFVTAAGMPLDRAAAALRAMHGPNRIPALLARVDALARGSSTKA